MPHQEPIYLDHLSTTPVDVRVFEAMRPFFCERFGNAASQSHGFGWDAARAVDQAREEVATLVGASPAEIVFTSGATEAIDLALQGTAEMLAARGRHIVTTAVEHKAVLDTCAHLECIGFELTYVAPDSTGWIDAERVAEALREDTILIATMWANNEVGTINPIPAIGELARERGVLLMTDASQAVGKIPVDFPSAGVALASFSAHKLYGPKGVGALFVRRRDPRVRLAPRIHGGGHERGLRSGTLNVPGIVGFGRACALAGAELEAEGERIAAQRDRLEELLSRGLSGVERNGVERDPVEAGAGERRRLPGCLNLSFSQTDAEDLLVRLGDRLAVSSGSACTSADRRPSHVLEAMGLSPQRVASSLRFGLGRTTSDQEVERAAELVVEAVRAQREARASEREPRTRAKLQDPSPPGR